MDEGKQPAHDQNSAEDWKKQQPLGHITCSSSDCENDLHCFRNRRPRNGTYRNHVCNSCGKDLIDWDRLDRHRLSDIQYTFRALKYEEIRHHYWHKDFDQDAMKKAKELGMNGLKLWAEHRLECYVNKISDENPWDGRQTPMSGHIVYYAQHATACCCRKCMEEWHGIDRNRLLTKSEISYFVSLIMVFIEDRLPGLPTHGNQLPHFKTLLNK